MTTQEEKEKELKHMTVHITTGEWKLLRIEAARKDSSAKELAEQAIKKLVQTLKP